MESMTGARGIDELRPDEENPRDIDEDARASLAASQREFGDISGIVLNARTGTLVCGHQRVKALRAAGAKQWTKLSETEGFVLHPVTGERFPVRIVDWDGPTHQVACIAANNPAAQGYFTGAQVEQLREVEGFIRYSDLRLAELLRGLEAGQPEVPGLTPNVEPGTTARDADEVPCMVMGRTRVEMTGRDVETVGRLLERYAEEFGSRVGFVGWLVDAREAAL